MPIYLSDIPLADPDRNSIDRTGNLAAFIALPAVAQLGWPDAVVEDWLFEHGGHPPFRRDYAAVELDRVAWSLEELPVAEFARLRTGRSEREALDGYAAEHAHWLHLRVQPIRDEWELHGTWLSAPILLSRELLSPPRPGLQLIEGRTRVGILQGRLRDSLAVADSHKAWVGRARRAV